MSWTFEPVTEPREFTEGPVWDPEDEVVFFTDIPSSTIVRYDPSTGESEPFITDTRGGNGMALGPDRRLYVCQRYGHQLVAYDRDGNERVVADEYRGDRLYSPNDLVFDREGRLWFTDPDYDDQEDAPLDHKSVYRLDPGPDDEWDVTRVTHDTTAPNGLLLSPDEETLYVAQSEYGEGNPRELRAYPVEDDGTVGEYEVLHNFYPHRGIDGMCLDEEGKLIATAGWGDSGPGPMLYVFTPEGRVLETHPYPANKATNCAFGGEDLSTLYVTGSDGRLHRAETDLTGYPVPCC